MQKQLGTRLRKIVQKYKGTDKPLHGKGNLTNSAINSMQNYYGIAIRNNTNNIYAMKKAIGAVLWHSTNFSDNSTCHSMCPRDEYSWCKWQLDKLKVISTHTNMNTSRRTFELCINSAIVHYNDSGDGVKSVLSYFGLLGSLTIPKLVLKDQKQIVNKRLKSTSICKKHSESDDYFILINFLLLKKLMVHTVCPNCFIGNLLIKDSVGSCMGFCHLLEMKCTKCNFSKDFRTSPKSKNSLNTNEFPIDTVKKELSPLESPYEINLQAVIGLREIGDKKRISQMRCKSSEKGKKRRKTLRAIKKGHLDEEKAKECNDSYVSGGF